MNTSSGRRRHLAAGPAGGLRVEQGRGLHHDRVPGHAQLIGREHEAARRDLLPLGWLLHTGIWTTKRNRPASSRAVAGRGRPGDTFEEFMRGEEGGLRAPRPGPGRPGALRGRRDSQRGLRDHDRPRDHGGHARRAREEAGAGGVSDPAPAHGAELSSRGASPQRARESTSTTSASTGGIGSSGSRKRQKTIPVRRPAASIQLGTPGSRWGDAPCVKRPSSLVQERLAPVERDAAVAVGRRLQPVVPDHHVGEAAARESDPRMSRAWSGSSS